LLDLGIDIGVSDAPDQARRARADATSAAADLLGRYGDNPGAGRGLARWSDGGSRRRLAVVIRRHPLATFLVLAVGATWAVWLPRALGAPVGPVGQLWTWVVAVAAVLAALLTGGRGAVRELLSRLVRWRVGLRWYAVVLLGPAAFWVLTALLFAALGGTWDDGPLGITATDWALLPVVLLIAALTDGLGEELGTVCALTVRAWLEISTSRSAAMT
jgi:hypothetical protein